MTGLVPAIHALSQSSKNKTRMPGHRARRRRFAPFAGHDDVNKS
jgi:hypothetical protein